MSVTRCCNDCDKPLSRLRYFPRQMLTADCMRAEQDYWRDRSRRAVRYQHGFGVVCGLDVRLKDERPEPVAGRPPPRERAGSQVWVCPGYAVTPEGDDILLDCPVCVDLATGKQDPDPCCDPFPCPPLGRGGATSGPRGLITVWLVIRYAECATRPVKVPPAGCGCDEVGCDYSRIRESYEIRCLPALPSSHERARAREDAWRQTFREWLIGSADSQQRGPMPVPACPECPPDPWVVLATIVLQKLPGEPLSIVAIQFDDRRVLLSTQSIQAALQP